MTKMKSDRTFSEIGFYLDSYPSCCGIQVATNLDCYEGDGDLTIEKAVDRFCKDINQQREKTCIQLSVVTRYSGSRGTDRGQMPDGFVEALVARKWKIDQVFKNSNTGNEVTVLSKVFPKKRVKTPPNGGIFAGNQFTTW